MAMWVHEGEEALLPSSPTATSGSQRCGARGKRLCGVDTTGLTVSLATLPVWLAYHARSREHVGGKEMSFLTGGMLFVRMI